MIKKTNFNKVFKFYKMSQKLGQRAFTLAEVLITLSIIGVVAALTIPSLIENHNNKAWATAKDLWNKKLVEVTRQMNIDGVMTGVASSTEDYMNYFKKYVKVIKTCNNDKLSNCYSPEMVLTGGDNVDVSSLTNANSLGHNDWGTNTMSFVIADGTTIIMAYNPNCESIDPLSSEGQSGQVGCMSMLIDVNGKKGPNKVGDDIELKNATISPCDILLGSTGICAGGSDLEPIVPISTCTGSGNESYDDRGDHSNCATNYWAGAKKACDQLGMRLTTPQELADVATYVYKLEKNPLNAEDGRYSLTPDSTRVSKISWSVGDSQSYWADESLYGGDAYYRIFDTSYTAFSYNGFSGVSFSAPNARCVSK